MANYGVSGAGVFIVDQYEICSWLGIMHPRLNVCVDEPRFEICAYASVVQERSVPVG